MKTLFCLLTILSLNSCWIPNTRLALGIIKAKKTWSLPSIISCSQWANFLRGIRRGGEWDSFSVGQDVSLGVEAQVACLEDKTESRRQISWIIFSLFHDSLLSIHWVNKQDQTFKATGCHFFCSRKQISYYYFWAGKKFPWPFSMNLWFFCSILLWALGSQCFRTPLSRPPCSNSVGALTREKNPKNKKTHTHNETALT